METVFESIGRISSITQQRMKHVPLMEGSPNEAIKNNVFGTYKTAKAADKYGTKRFVLISTDKAVNPTNIMGSVQKDVRDGHSDDEYQVEDGLCGGKVWKCSGEQWVGDSVV